MLTELNRGTFSHITGITGIFTIHYSIHNLYFGHIHSGIFKIVTIIHGMVFANTSDDNNNKYTIIKH